MKKIIPGLLNIAEEDVSIKATIRELGYVGWGEGVNAMAGVDHKIAGKPPVFGFFTVQLFAKASH